MPTVNFETGQITFEAYQGPAEVSVGGCLWGPKKDRDFWAASRAGLVKPEELRAMTLLASLSDERRFRFYCLFGMYPAMGNVTKRVYMVRRFTTVLELDAGSPVGSWCILTGDRGFLPETDHVVTLKNVIEGEELAFRQTGNKFRWNHDPFHGRVTERGRFPNAFTTPFMESGHQHQDEDFRAGERARRAAGDASKAMHDRAVAAQKEAHARALEAARRWSIVPYQEPVRPRFLARDRQLLAQMLEPLQNFVGTQERQRSVSFRADGSLFS